MNTNYIEIGKEESTKEEKDTFQKSYDEIQKTKEIIKIK